MPSVDLKPHTKSELLGERPRCEEFLRQRACDLSAFSFVNIFIWSDFFDFQFKVIDDNLCVFARGAMGTFLYLPPLGKAISARAVAECFALMEKANKGSPVTRIENIAEKDRARFPAMEFSLYKKSDEYLYEREAIAGLKGNALKSKRSSYNHFSKNNKFEFLPFADDMQSECEGLYDDWAASRERVHADEIYVQMLEDNRLVHRLAFKHYRDLGLIGRVVRVEGKIKAYTFGYQLNRDVFCVLFEVADLAIKGLPVYIFSEFCRIPELKEFKYINVMDDFGMKNIETTKLSFHPVRALASWSVTRKAASL